MSVNEIEIIESIEQKNIENFKKNGGINMYIHNIPEDKKEKSEKDAVLEKIKEINSKYVQQEYVPEEIKTLGLEEMDYDAPTSEEIERQAQESLKQYKDNEISSINLKYDTKFSNLSESAEKALLNKEDGEVYIDSGHDSSLRKAQNTNIKRGLAHSSIYENAVKAIEGEKINKLSEVEQEYNKTISKLENERSILEQQKEGALTSFDISYAVKLQNKISSISSQIAKEQDKILKYNQDIAKQEAAYKKEQETAIAAEQKKVDQKNKELQNLIDKKGITEVSKMKAQEKYDVILGYLSNMPRAEALNELENDSTYKNELGSYYNLLYAQMLKRKD